MTSSASHEAVDDCGETTRNVVPGVPGSPFSPFAPCGPTGPGSPFSPASPFSPLGASEQPTKASKATKVIADNHCIQSLLSNVGVAVRQKGADLSALTSCLILRRFAKP